MVMFFLYNFRQPKKILIVILNYPVYLVTLKHQSIQNNELLGILLILLNTIRGITRGGGAGWASALSKFLKATLLGLQPSLT